MDDFLAKKKESTPILDLSKATASNKEEFKRLLERIPDFKIKAEKVYVENLKFRDKNFKFKSGRKDLKAMRQPYTFLDPLPNEMRSLKIVDLAAVQIDWKMLTTHRPKNKTEESFFTRLVELGKLEMKTRAQEKRQFSMDPQVRKTKNRSGIAEMRVVSCTECGEDFCNGNSVESDKIKKINVGSYIGKACIKFGYDSFTRVPEVPKLSQKIVAPEASKTAGKKKKKVKRKPRSKSKTKKKSASKSKSPKRISKK